MECKVHLSKYRGGVTTWFNRYIVECKGSYKLLKSKRKFDLIDTLWNVKSRSIIAAFASSIDLIETLWNVNITKPCSVNDFVKRFNRNILECKYQVCYCKVCCGLWFNRNILECKLSEKIHTKHRHHDLIETSWNVKNLHASRSCSGSAWFNRKMVECKVHRNPKLHYAPKWS